MNDVNRKIAYRMYPNIEQTLRMEEMMGLHCRAYNALLEEHQRRHEIGLPSYSFSLMCKDLTAWRARVPALGTLSAQALQVTAKRVSLAFTAFFRRIKAGEEPGYPRFKSQSRYSGWGYKTHGDGWRLFGGPGRSHSLRLSGVGDIRLRGKGRFTGIPKTAEIIRKQGKWYVSVTFVVEADQVARATGTETAAFDWGVKSLLTIAKADGTIETVENPRHLKQKLAALVKLQRTISKEELEAKESIGLAADQPILKGTRLPVTKRLKRLYREISAIHVKISRQRHDFYHKLSALLVARFGNLATEELAVKEMVRRPEPKQDTETGEFLPNGSGRKATLHREIHDAAPAMLLSMIRVKAEEAGTGYSEADTKKLKPTQRCHCCGTLVPKDLSERWHDCPICNTRCGRDVNAAKTILRWFLEGNFWLGTSHAGLCLQETPSIAA